MGVRFTVEDIRLVNLHYGLTDREESQANEHSDQDSVPVPVELICNSNYDPQKRLLKVTVTATLKDPKPAFTLSAEVGGLFHLDSDPDKETLARLRHINCPAMLFPYLREVISEISRRGGFDPVNLPPVNFVSMYRTSKEPQEESIGERE